MLTKTFEEIKPWDGTSGTGAEAREVIKQNFAKVNEALTETEQAITTEQQTRAAAITSEANTRIAADNALAASVEMALVLAL